MTTQDLVPQGLPQGSRQDVVARMRQAGLPTDSETGGGAAPTPGPTAGLPSAVPSSPAAGPDTRPPPVDTSNFDVLAGREPDPNFVSAPPKQVMFEQVRQSPNRVMQSIFSRMSGYKEG